MKKIIPLLFLCIPFYAYADIFSITIPHQCAKTEKMFNDITKEWGEKPVAIGNEMTNGKGEKAVVTTWFNEKKKTMTVIYTSKAEGVSCIMATAENVEVFPAK